MGPEAQSARTSSRTGSAMETVLIRVPADADYLAIVRSASAHVATKLGCTLSEVADLRLAVDEACGLLLRHTMRDRRAGVAVGAGGGSSDGAHEGAGVGVGVVAGSGDGAGPHAGGRAGVGDLECCFALDGTALRVLLSRHAHTTAPPQSDEFGWTILSALVDDIVWRVEGPRVQVEILKRRPARR